MFGSVRWNKVLRDGWRHKARSLLVVLAIAVGVATFGMLLTARQAAIVDMYAGYWGNVPPNIILFVEPFGEELPQIVRKLPEIADAEARAGAYARVRPVDAEAWINLELTVIQDYEDSRISVVQPESGAWPSGRREVLFERSSSVLLDVAHGESVVVEMPGGVQKDVRIAGTAHEFNNFSSYISRVARAFVTLDTLEWLGLEPAYDRLYLTVADPAVAADAGRLERVRNEVIDRVERCGYRVVGFDDYLTRPGKHWAYDFFSALMLVLGGVGVLSLFLSGFLVMNTTMALLAQETRQIGVMKAVGAQRGQIVAIYLATVLLYGSLALVVAVPLGLVSGRWFADFGAYVMNYEISSYGLMPWVLALQVAMALGVPALAALVPVYRGTRKTVREAISDYGIANVKPGAIDQLVARLRGLPRPLMFSLRNTFRRKARLVLTLLALSLSGATLIGVLSTHASMLRLLDDILQLYDYEVEVYFAEPVRPQLVRAVAQRMPGITHVESWMTRDARYVQPDGDMGITFPLFGLPTDQQTVHGTMVEGRWLLPEDENAVVVSTDLLRALPELEVGSDLTVEMGARESTWRVVGVMVTQDERGYANLPALGRASGLPGRATRGVFRIEHADDPAAQQAVARALEAQYERAGMSVSVSQTIAEIREMNVNQGSMVTYFLLVMAALLAIVGGLGLGATMGLNVLERTREIGVLRAIGASNSAMRGIILAEGVVIGLLSWVLGAALSLPVGRLLSGGVGLAFFGMWIEYVFSYAGIALWLAVAVVVSVVASLLPARRASRISVREALAYE